MEKIFTYHNYTTRHQQIDFKTLPKLLQQGHAFFMEALPQYHQLPEIKEAMDLYLQKLNEHFSVGSNTAALANKNVDRSFIDRFVKLHNQKISKFEIGQYVLGLQDAISHKLIVKSSPLASHITKIQRKLIKEYNRLLEGEHITIVINGTWLASLKGASKSNTVVSSTDLGALDATNIGDTASASKSKRLFAAMDAIDEEVSDNTFRLDDDFGVFLGDLERFELAITIEGDQGSGKTRFTYQLANAFAKLHHRIAIFSLEIGSKSDLIRRMKEDYLEPQLQSQVFIADTLPNGMDSIREAAKQFDVVIIDSWNKVGVSSLEFDSLRKQFPNTIFIVIFQRTTQKTIRGGTAPLYDAGINIEVVKADTSFKNNYAVTTKNRYGVTGIEFNIFSQQVVNHNAQDNSMVSNETTLNS